MPPTLTTILIVVSLTALTAWWNIQIKFAASKDEAIKMWKRTVYIICNIIVLTIQVWTFVTLMLSKEPLTKVLVAVMIITVAGMILTALGFTFVIFTLHVNRLIGIQTDIHKDHLAITKGHVDGTENAFQKLLAIVQGINERVGALEEAKLPPPEPPKQIEQETPKN